MAVIVCFFLKTELCSNVTAFISKVGPYVCVNMSPFKNQMMSTLNTDPLWSRSMSTQGQIQKY